MGSCAAVHGGAEEERSGERPGAIPGAGAEHGLPHPNEENPCLLVGGAAPVPPPSLAFVLASFAPRAGLGGAFGAGALRLRRAQGGGGRRARRLAARFSVIDGGRPPSRWPPRAPGPPTRPLVSDNPSCWAGRRRGSSVALCGPCFLDPRGPALPPSSLRALRARPLRPWRWGGGGWVPSRPCRPLPAGASAAPGGGGRVVLGSLVFFGGASWPLSRSFLPLPPCCVPRGLVWLPGRVPPWAFRSAPRRVPCAASWRWFVSARWLALARSPVRGRGACRPLVAGLWFARFPPRLACRLVGWSRFRFRRRPCRFGAVARLAALPRSLRRGAALARSRAWAPGRVRGGPSRRLPGPTCAGLGGRVVRRLPLAFGGPRGRAPRALVRAPRAGLRPARSGLACCRGVAPRRAPLPRFSPARRVRAGRGARPAGLAVAGSPARRFLPFSFAFRTRRFSSPGPAFLGGVGDFICCLLKINLIYIYYFVIIYDKDMDKRM
jgi:hypothetical protein